MSDSKHGLHMRRRLLMLSQVLLVGVSHRFGRLLREEGLLENSLYLLWQRFGQALQRMAESAAQFMALGVVGRKLLYGEQAAEGREIFFCRLSALGLYGLGR